MGNGGRSNGGLSPRGCLFDVTGRQQPADHGKLCGNVSFELCRSVNESIGAVLVLPFERNNSFDFVSRPLLFEMPIPRA